MSVFARRVVTAVLVIIALPAIARAQNESHWGAVVSFTPEWKVPSQLGSMIDNGTVSITGSDFSIGIVHGRANGGDWGISYIRSTWKEGSTIDDTSQDCQFSNGCFTQGTTWKTRSVQSSGVLVHKYVSFGTIKNHVQIGMNFAGGIGSFSGNIERHELNADLVGYDSRTRQPIGKQSETVSMNPATSEIASNFPVGQIQIGGAYFPVPAFKVRVMGGLDFPGTTKFTVTGIYFFGAH